MEDRSLKPTSVARAAFRPQRMRLGDVLVAQKLITVEQLRTALEAQTRRGRRLGRLFVELGYLSDEQVAQALARQLGLRYIDLAQHNFNPQVVQKLPESAARRFRALPIEERGNTILVAMADPADLFSYDELTRILKRDVQAAVAPEGQLLKALDQVYRRTEEITGLAKELQQDLGDNAVDFGALSASLGADDAPVVRLLQTLFEDATQVGASDIHIEPQEDGLRIRLRIDGELNPQTEADLRVAPALALRLKFMAGLALPSRRLPPDGRFNVVVRDNHVGVGMSTMPAPHREAGVLRLLQCRKWRLCLRQTRLPSGDH